MKLYVCAAYDAAVKAYLQPFFSRSVNEATRSFRDAVTAENSQFSRHAADFHLALLGEFDDGTAAFVCPAAPTRLITALECVDDNVFPLNKKIV